MAPHIRRGNAARSKVRAVIEHVFAQQKGPMALCIRTIGIAPAKVRIGLANLTYNISRLAFHEPQHGAGMTTVQPQRITEDRDAQALQTKKSALV